MSPRPGLSLPRAWLALVPLLLAGACRKESAPQPQRPPPDQDPRVAYLLEPCPRSHHYSVDTSDVLAILEETLLHGERDPLNRARIELATYGPAGIEIAQRVIAKHWNDIDGVNHIRNALEVLQRAPASSGEGAEQRRDPAAGDAIRPVLEHPLESLRIAALRALRPHGEPRDYERVRAMLETVSLEFRAEVVLALHRLDPARAEEEYTRWIASDERQGLWNVLARELAGSKLALTRERACTLWPKIDPAGRAYLAACCAAGGDAQALAAVRAALRAEDVNERANAVEAAELAGLHDELVHTLLEDPVRKLRLSAAKAFLDPAVRTRMRPHLLAAMSSSDVDVAHAAMSVLAIEGEESAIQRALALIGDPRPGSLEAGVHTLRPLLATRPALIEPLLERVLEYLATTEGRPLQESLPALQVLGALPSERGARILIERSIGARGELGGLDAERWLLMHAGNTGPAGQALLVQQLDVETDPARRLDLIEGFSLLGNETARSALLAFLEREDRTPFEVLYAADRLTRIGPAEIVAPVLKRETLRTEEPRVRVALQCLLWKWYPGPP